MRKLKVLFVNESSFLQTGYSRYGLNLLKKLYDLNKYEIAEFGVYSSLENPQQIGQIMSTKWRFYTNLPNSQEEARVYESNPLNQFGEWRFEEVLLDFHPDICVTNRDHWMDGFVHTSPLRRFYKWIAMPAIDSAPLQEQWIDMYLDADAVLGYAKFAGDTLQEQGGGKINFCGVASPGADISIYKPLNKKNLRLKYKLDPNAFIVGTVMRNQKRKLFPDLISAFSSFLQKNPSIAEKSYLYLHTTYPDIGWDLPRLIKESNISNHILVTYLCPKCQNILPSQFRDAQIPCPYCGNSMVMPNTQFGVSDEKLAEIYNLFNIHVQYIICLGKNEEVLTKDGWKPIPTIKNGEYVWTQQGNWKPVLNVWQNLSKDKIVKEISIHSDYEKLIITDNHKVLSYSCKDIVPLKNKSLRETIGDYIRCNRILPSPTFKEVSELQNGDLLISTIDDTIEDKHLIDLSEYNFDSWIVTESTINSHLSKYPRFINLDKDFCRLLGLYVGDGSSSKLESNNKSVRITCHIEDNKCIELATKGLQKLTFGEIKQRKYQKDEKCIDIILCSKLHSDFLKTECGTFTNKRFPQWCIHLPLEKQKELLIGLLMADGHYNKEKGFSIYVTISPILAKQVKLILKRLRLNFSCHITKPRGNRQPLYRFEISGNIKSGEFLSNRTNTNNLYIGNQFCVKIKSIKDIEYNDDVYNLEVQDDNTYTTKLCSAANCGAFELPAMEAACCGIPIIVPDYSGPPDIVDHVGGFKIKIGKFYREAETHCIRTYPDDDHFVEILNKFIKMLESEQIKLGFSTSLKAHEYYNWDNAAKVWEKTLDSLPFSSNWEDKPKLHQIPNEIPQELNNVPNNIFVQWCIANVLGEPEKVNSYMALKLTKDLNYGVQIKGHGGPAFSEDSTLAGMTKFARFTREDLVNELKNMAQKKNYWEQRRCNLIPKPHLKFIEHVKLDEQEQEEEK